MLKRVAALAGLTAATLIASAAPAMADDIWGYTDCSQVPVAGCELGAGQNPQQPVRPGPGGSDTRPSPGHGQGQQQQPGDGQHHGSGDESLGAGNPQASCQYVLSEYQGPPPGGAQPASFGFTAVGARAEGGQSAGAWYVYQCTGEGASDGVFHPPVWIAGAAPAPGGQPVVSPAELALRARNQLRLPTPVIRANPTGDQLVNLPTWLWLDRASWGPVSATAAVPGVSVTATAKPTSVSWSMGEGGSVSCAGAGSAFSAGTDPRSASPDCGYTYRAAGSFSVRATVHWSVSWSGAGTGGVFPDLTTAAQAPFRVVESQGLTTG